MQVLIDLAAEFRAKAEKLETAAQGYNKRCVAVKGVQCLLRAKELRECADRLDEARQADEEDRNASAAEKAGTLAAVAGSSQAPDRQEAPGAKLPHQAP
jgi:hypothetical protein